jgi:hypothetical protein
MGRQLILHIGRHKTGTTSLQRFLSLNDRILLDQHNILYPTTGRRGNQHYPIFWRLINDKDGIDREIIDRVEDEVQEQNANKVILSSEILSRPSVTKKQLSIIKNEFGLFNISVLVFFREQHDFLESMYAERVKKRLLWYPDNIFNVNYALNYYDFIKKYADVFGKENIIIFSYKKHQEHSIFNDCLRALECKPDNKFELPSRKNTRLPWMYIEMLRRVNKNKQMRSVLAGRKMRKIARIAYKIIPGIVDRPKPLSYKERDMIMDTYEETNKMLAREYLDRDSLF